MGSHWTDPAVDQVAPGVFRIPLPMPQDGLRAINVYAVLDAGRLVMIDGGWNVPAARDTLLAALNTLGAGPPDIDRFLITHLHSDHYTLATAIRAEFGTPVDLGEGERPGSFIATTPFVDGLFSQIKYLLLMGAARLAAVVSASAPGPYEDRYERWELPDNWLADGQFVEVGQRRLQVIATPGHTSGHVVFHDAAAGLLFTGDHVLPTITPSIAFDGLRAEHPLRDFLNSLRLLEELPDAMLLPAHGAPTDSVHARLTELAEHHAQRLELSERAVARGASTGLHVALVLPWTRHHRALADLDTTNQMLAISETGAHLDLLVLQGRLRCELRDGVLHHWVA